MGTATKVALLQLRYNKKSTMNDAGISPTTYLLEVLLGHLPVFDMWRDNV